MSKGLQKQCELLVKLVESQTGEAIPKYQSKTIRQQGSQERHAFANLADRTLESGFHYPYPLGKRRAWGRASRWLAASHSACTVRAQ